MAVMCNCEGCGGDDPYQICDNLLIKIQGDISRQQRRQRWLIPLAVILVVVGLLCAV